MGWRRGRRKRRRSRRPLYICMVKTAMAYLKKRQCKGSTASQIEHKVLSMYKKRGLDSSNNRRRVKDTLLRLIRSRCVSKTGHHYRIVDSCARDTLSRHKRRRSRRRSINRSQSRRRRTHRRRRRQRNTRRRRRRSQSKGRHKRRRRRRSVSGSQSNSVCQVAAPCDTPPHRSNPFSQYSIRDAVIIGISVMLSFWMQRAAFRMQMPNFHGPIN